MGLSPDELQAVRLSLQVALAAVAVSLPLGVALGWLLARRDFAGKVAVETLVNLPLVLPPVVTGYLLLITFGRRAPVGSFLADTFGIVFSFRWTGAALACGIMAFPLMVRAIRLTFAAVDPRLEQASRTLGVGPLGTFVHVTLPLARGGIVAGCVLAFARSMGEFGATVMIAGNIPGQTRTIPLFIYTMLESPGGAERAWRVVVLSVILSAAALLVGEYLDRRGRVRLAAVNPA